MAQDRDGIVALGSTRLDIVGGTLSRDGRILSLRSKSFRLLCELASPPGRVRTKQELLDAVWPDVIVTEDSLTQAVRDIRRALGADGERLRTIARRGFLLLADEAAPAARPEAPSGSRPRIAVLPLVDRSGEGGAFLDGLIEEITGGLARFRNLTVIARHSAFAAAAEGLSLEAIGQRLRADFVVDGTARPAKGGLRLSLALNDVRTGEVLWSDSFGTEGTGWLTLQDAVPRRIVMRLFSGVEEAGHRSALRGAPGRLTAFEHLARGKALFRSYDPGVNERAQAHFLAAIEADPTLGTPHAYLGLVEMALHDYGLAPEAIKRQSKARGLRAVELSPDESRCHGLLSYFQGWLREFDASERSAGLAVELNPGDPDALYGMAIVHLDRGRHAEALLWFERAKDVNPLWPAFYDGDHAAALFHLGRYEQSAQLLLRLPRLTARAEMRLAATYALMGDPEAARRHAAQARSLAPSLDFLETARRGYIREREEDLRQLLDGIALALRLLDGS